MAGVTVYEPIGAVETGRKKPPLSEFKELTDQHKGVIALMVHGLDEGGDIDGQEIPAHKPLTLVQAASAMGMRRKQAREIAQTDVFLAELNRQVKARAQAEKPRNLQRLIEIRDREGQGMAADVTASLKAIAQMEGKDDRQAAVNVTVNAGCDQRQVKAGYVIRLGDGSPVSAAVRPAGTADNLTGEVLDLTADRREG